MGEVGFDGQSKYQERFMTTIRRPYVQWGKRVLDVVVSSILLLITAPLWILIALGIKLHSQGPVLYRQQRIGKNGVPFDMLKFRSMRVNADPNVHKEHVQSLIANNTSPENLGVSNLKLKSDPRITGLGKILRSFGLDEMPQLINVLRGEMSIVGPRPPLSYEYELYSTWHKRRLFVSPGITGLWQVTAHNQVTFNRMVEIDLDYIMKTNLWMDLKIMILTPFEMIRRRG
jgi:lipopolysaccharide/colanic/teichoic acid biosynthesis glycosyltransferase